MSILDSVIEATKAAATETPEVKAERERVAHLAQVKQDEEALRRAGFEVEPTVVPWGLAVNSTGVANARLKREEWEARPTVPEAASWLRLEVERENRLSVPVTVADLQIDPSTGRLHRKGVTGKPGLTVTPAAWNNLMGLLATSARRKTDNEKPGWFPDSAGAFIGSLPPSWRAEEFDRLVRLANGREAVFKILHPRGDRETPLLYAVTSERYTDFGALEVADAMEQASQLDSGLKGMRAEVTYLPGTRVSFRASAHSNVDAGGYVAGEIFSAGVTMKAWENKGGGVIGSADFERNRCLNLIVLQHGKLKVFSMRHMGIVQRLHEAAVAGVAESLTKIGHFVSQWQDAWKTVDAIDVITAAKRMTGAYEGAKKADAKVAIPGVEQGLLLNWILEAYAMEPHASKAGLVNAIARTPQVAEARSPAQSILIQEILAETAGEVLAMPDQELITLSAPFETELVMQ